MDLKGTATMTTKSQSNITMRIRLRPRTFMMAHPIRLDWLLTLTPSNLYFMQDSDDGGDDDDDEEVQVVEKDSQEGMVFAQSPLFSAFF